MSETIVENEATEKPVVESAAGAVSDDQLIGMLVDRARTEGLQLTGEGGLLQQLTKRGLRAPWKGRSRITSAMTSTMRKAGAAATAVTAPAQRPS
jgi:hypothetical protein